MNRIEKLTPEQTARFPEFVARWKEIGLCMQPADRPRAEEGVREAYQIADLAPPHKIIWCGSPLSAGLTRAIVFDLTGQSEAKISDSIGTSVRTSVWNSVWDSVRTSIGASIGTSVRTSVGNSVWDSVRDSVRDSVWTSVWDSVRTSVWDSVGTSVWTSVRDSVIDSVRDSIGDSVRDSIGDSVRDSVWTSVRDSVWDSVRNSVGTSVWTSVRDSVWDSVRTSVWNSVWDSVRTSVWTSIGASIYGQHDAGWLAFYEYFRDACGLLKETRRLCGIWKVAQSANWWLPHQKTCWISERHNILNRDERGRLHCENGPALAYPDGFSIFAWHGVRLSDSSIILAPEHQTIEKINGEPNEEIKRVRIERFGWERYLTESKASVVDEEFNERDWQQERLYETADGIRRIVVSDPSTGRRYALSCPREISTCRAARNWLSHGLDSLAIHRS